MGIPAEMVQFILKLFLKQIILVVYYDFHWVLGAMKSLTAKLHSLYVKEWVMEISRKVGVGVEHFTSDSATLVTNTKLNCFQPGVRETS